MRNDKRPIWSQNNPFRNSTNVQLAQPVAELTDRVGSRIGVRFQ